MTLALHGAAMARPVETPLEAVREAPAVTVAATVVALDPAAATIEIDIDEALRGEASGRATLKVMPSVQAHLAVGERYLMVYADRRKVPEKPGTFAPIDPVLLAPTGFEPAVLRDTASNRALLADTHAAVERSDRYRGQVIAGLASVDPHLQNLNSAELAYRPRWWADLSARERAAVLALIDNPDAHPAARARLLIEAARYRSLFGKDVLAASARRIVAEAPIAASDGLYNPEQIVFAAFDTLDLMAMPVPEAALRRWLRHSRAALSERALLGLRALDPALEREALDQVLADNLLPTATRTFLLDHQRRLLLAAESRQDRNTP